MCTLVIQSKYEISLGRQLFHNIFIIITSLLVIAAVKKLICTLYAEGVDGYDELLKTLFFQFEILAVLCAGKGMESPNKSYGMPNTEVIAAL